MLTACCGPFGVRGQALGGYVSGGACLDLALLGGSGSAEGVYSRLYIVVC